MKTLVLVCAILSTLSLLANPKATVTSFAQDASGEVTVTYSLDEDAIVTLDLVDENEVSIGDRRLATVFGDVNRTVEAGTGRQIHWRPTAADQAVDVPNCKALVKTWTATVPPDYMVVDLCVPETVNYYVSTNAFPVPLGDDLYRTDKMVFRRVPAKDVVWNKGRVSNEMGCNSAEKNLEKSCKVLLTKDYWMGVYEVTQRQYQLVLGRKWSKYAESDRMLHPVESACYTCRTYGGADQPDIRGKTKGALWPVADESDGLHAVDADSFMGRIRVFTGLDGLDLPTDAQWEYACRAESYGSYQGDFVCVNTSADYSRYLGPIAWFSKNSGYNSTSKNTATHVVGGKRPNAWGIYDMLGNVQEWVLDYTCECPADTNALYYVTQPAVHPGVQIDPLGPKKTDGIGNRVIRGGNFTQAERYVRSSYPGNRAGNNSPTSPATIGFRICCEIDPESVL